MNYTKGEWRAYKNPLGTWSISTDNEPIAQVERHYNANLIAAAPDMHEVLQRIAVLLANPLTTRQEATLKLRLIRAIDEAWQLARQVLAKAEGGKEMNATEETIKFTSEY